LNGAFVDRVGSASVVLAAVDWLQRALLGSVATVAAAIAVASIGWLMLTGRIDVRRAVSIIFGCFILFGASTIADGIMAAVQGSPASPDSFAEEDPAYHPPSSVPASTGVPASNDPYAGAAYTPGQ